MKKMTWDQAIRDAKVKLLALRKTIKYFEEMKRKREPWPGEQFRSATRKLAHYRSVSIRNALRVSCYSF